MSGEHAEQLPEDLRTWIEERAESSELDQSDVLARAVAAYRFLEGESEALTVVDGQTDLPVVMSEDIAEDLESLDERVDNLETELDEKIDDVRERVIQVKRETDQKAPTDHGHDDLRQQAEQALQAARDAREATAELESTVDRGFENYEEVLEYLTETTDELEEKVDTLARAAIDLRERVSDAEGDIAARKAVADLQAEANRQGVASAACEECESKVQLGLLASPTCPHCGATFRDVEPASSFFGSATLTTGSRPALESGEAGAPESPAELFEEQDEEE